MKSIQQPQTRRHERDSTSRTRMNRGVELVLDMPRRMTRRFSLGHISVQPMAQPTVEPAGGFAFESFAIAEEFGSTLKLGGSRRSSFELTNERKQVAKIVLFQFISAQRSLFGLELQDDLSALTNSLSVDIHAANRLVP